MIKKVKAFCRQKELLREGDRVLIGLSGGADSVCLFLILMDLREEYSLSVVPVHVHHNLRGEEADRDMQFCKELCEAYGLPLEVISAPVSEMARENGWSLEEAGRYARYEAFARICDEHGCTKIAVAHHKNDQAETMLFQLFRGSRLKGLAGMEAAREKMIRPLLCVTREEIEGFLSARNQKYCIDRTNFEEDYTRNRIRHGILPKAEMIQPKAVEHIAETAEYLGRVEDYLSRLTENVWKTLVKEQTETQIRLFIPELLAEEPLLSERVVYRTLCEVAGKKKDITALAVEQCLALCEKQTGRRIELPQGLLAIKEYETLCITKQRQKEETVSVPIEGFPWEGRIPGTDEVMHLSVRDVGENVDVFVEKEGGIPKSTCTKWFDYDKIKGSISLRNPLAEDVIALYTDGRGKRVFDVLAEAKIPKEERKKKVVLSAENQVLWIPGIRSCEAYRITEKTRRILIVTIDGGKKDGR